MVTWLRKFMEHSNWVPGVTQAAALQVDYFRLCTKKNNVLIKTLKISEIVSSVLKSLLSWMEVYPLEASLLDIFNFCIARTFKIIDRDLAKRDYF